MDEDKAIEYWDENADSWTTLSRLGYDICRDHLNNPAFLKLLPTVNGMSGLDIGCGEGTNTRLVAGLGARMIGIDPSPKFIRHAIKHADNSNFSIEFKTGKASSLQFKDQEFDFVISTMCLMDVPNLELVFSEIHRVLKKDGFLQFSIVHPCFSPPKSKWVVDSADNEDCLLVASYFKEGGFLDQWSFTTVPDDIAANHEDFKVLHYHRTLSYWINSLIEAGFTVERIEEPTPSADVIASYPSLARLKQVAWFLHVRARRS